MTEAEKRMKRCCFTGHRPGKLKQDEQTVKRSLAASINRAIARGYTTFITGMAQGTDIWAAEIALRLRESNPAIHLVAASPYRGFESRWSADWQSRDNAILQHADLVRFVCPSYSRDCFQRRNEWMVDRSSRVIAVYNGEPGGTRNTIEYANSKKVECVSV